MQKLNSVIIADAHYLVRVGLKQILVRQPNVRLMDEVDDESTLLKLIEEKKPEILFIDPFQKDVFSLKTLEAVKAIHADIKFIILTAETDKSSIYRVLEHEEVACFLTKVCDEFEIVEGISSIENEEKYFCKKIIKLIWQKSFGKQNDDCDGIPLSEREIQIVKMIVAGKITKQIAQELGLSPHTVYTHRKNIMKKLKLNSTPELVLFAVNHGLVKAS